MKKVFIIFSALFLLAFLFEQCKPDKNCPDPDPNDPDSLYVGIPDTIVRPYRFPPINLPSGNPLTKEGVLLGRMLFYDPVLSSDSSISCSSCHIQEFAFADGGKKFSLNIFGPTRRNTPPLFNLIWFEKFFWDGRSNTLPQQVNDALLHEQNFISSQSVAKLQSRSEYVALFKKAFGRPGDITDEKILKALAQFMMTLISGDSKFDKVMRGQASFTPSEDRGFYSLFLKDTIDLGADCFHCHASAAGTNFNTFVDNGFHNNGLDAANNFNDFTDKGLGEITGNFLDNGKFKTPHLRNIEVTGPYMRDGRFTTLEQVVNFYNDSLKMSPTNDPQIKTAFRGGLRYLSQQDKDDLIAFMKTLTDTAFLHNPKFSNPFH
jgi:cytochrome c peroxidase